MFRVFVVLQCALLSIACSNDQSQSPTQVTETFTTGVIGETGDASQAGRTDEANGTNEPDDSGDTIDNNEVVDPFVTDGTIQSQADTVTDSFDGNGQLLGFTTNNETALPDVVRKNGRYHATLLNNDNNVTLHFHDEQGRLDAKKLEFPFEFIARNIGIGMLTDSQVAPSPDDFPSSSSVYMFAGIQVHALDLEQRDSAHFVVGHRGSTSYTVEGKNTVSGRSSVNDAGQGIVPDGRADLRVIGHEDHTLTWYWQQSNMDTSAQIDDWIPYRGNGSFPGEQAEFGDEVYVGLITYAFNEANVGFVGTCDAIELISDTP